MIIIYVTVQGPWLRTFGLKKGRNQRTRGGVDGLAENV